MYGYDRRHVKAPAQMSHPWSREAEIFDIRRKEREDWLTFWRKLEFVLDRDRWSDAAQLSLLSWWLKEEGLIQQACLIDERLEIVQQEKASVFENRPDDIRLDTRKNEQTDKAEHGANATLSNTAVTSSKRKNPTRVKQKDSTLKWHADDKKCYKCGKLGHIRRNCPENTASRK